MIAQQLLAAAFRGICQDKMMELGRQPDLGRQYYHAAAHPVDVYNGARRVGICLVDQHYDAIDHIVMMAALAHDVVQDAVEVQKDGFAFRQRKRGDNERATAVWATETLKELQLAFGFDAIHTDSIDSIAKAILWTIPAWSTEFNTMVQPGLIDGLKDGDLDPIAISVAMGDLLPAGHHPQIFLATSDMLFVEEWVGIDRLLRKAKKMSDVPAEDAERALALMRAWDASQVKFVRGRQTAFAYELSLLPPEVGDQLRARVNKFPESAERARWRAESRMALNFFEYASMLGFKDVPIT